MIRKLVRLVATLGALAVAAAPGTTVSGPPFTLERAVIGPGGNSTAGNEFLLDATIGQPVAGRMESGAYVLQAGFWSATTPQVAELIFKDGYE